jgi:hypothetical protein
MKRIVQRTLWCVLALAVVLGLALDLIPRASARSRLETLPLQSFRLVGKDLPLSASETTVFGRTRVLKRLYQTSGTRFVLLAVDSGGDRHAIHDPLYCFRGAGWAVVGESQVALPGGEARVLRLTKGSQSVEAMYWFSDGRQRHTSATRLWWESVLSRLRLRDPSATPVLVLLQPVAGESVTWQDLPHHCPQLFGF